MIAYASDTFPFPLPDGHKFPIAKYARLRERLIEENLLSPASIEIPHAASDEELARGHDREWIDRVARGDLSEVEQRRIGFPWSPALVERSRRSAAATVLACRAALDRGVGINLAGGTHHAFRDRGEGFCVFNDAAVAARAVQAEGRARRVVVLDTDVHQGNGTAAIFEGDESVFTFSIHGANNFPRVKERSDLDVALDDGTTDEAYLAALDRGLREALDRARADLAIWVSGADPHVGDRFGRLAVTKAGLLERDRRVLEACRRAGLPIAVAMGGGYGRNLEDTVDIHLATVALVAGLSWTKTGSK